jgi:hypothetical protein
MMVVGNAGLASIGATAATRSRWNDRLAVMGEEFMKKSKELGHRAELFTAEGQPHGFFNRPPWLERTTQRMDEFLVSIGYLEVKATNSGN